MSGEFQLQTSRLRGRRTNHLAPTTTSHSRLLNYRSHTTAMTKTEQYKSNKSLFFYLFLMGRHSLGMSPGDFGIRRSDGASSSRVLAFRSRGGGMGFTFRKLFIERSCGLSWMGSSILILVRLSLGFQSSPTDVHGRKKITSL